MTRDEATRRAEELNREETGDRELHHGTGDGPPPLLRGRPRPAVFLQRGSAAGEKAIAWLRRNRRAAAIFVALAGVA